MDLLLYIMLAGIVIQKLVWNITDPRPKIEIVKSDLGINSGYGKATWIVFIIFIILWKFILYNIPLQMDTKYNLIFSFFGALLFFPGITLSLWARLTMKERWQPAGEGHDTKRQNHLITSGPFRYTRNPIYLGLTLMYLGLGIAARTYLIVLIIFNTYYFYKSAINEEKMLEKIFSEKYLKYKERVRRFI